MPKNGILLELLYMAKVYSSIAQLVEHAAVNRRVVGSSPTRGAGAALSFNEFKHRHKVLIARPLGQAVKTSPFHGGNTGSIPVGVICIFLICIHFIEITVVSDMILGAVAKW